MATTDMSGQSGYANSRFNALKHGLLSRQLVLPHESREEFEQIRQCVLLEYQPVGLTELALAEELAGILWRKRRMLEAEGAQINNSIKRVLRSTNSVINAAVPIHLHREGMEIDDDTGEVRRLLAMSSAEMLEDKEAIQAEESALEAAAGILDAGGIRAGRRAVAALSQDQQVKWESTGLSENQYEVGRFLRQKAWPEVQRRKLDLRYVEEIRRHVEGRAVATSDFEKLARYEAHLDRKFEKTVGMLLRLRSMRMAELENKKLIE